MEISLLSMDRSVPKGNKPPGFNPSQITTKSSTNKQKVSIYEVN